MADPKEDSAAETAKKMMNPRAEIDTSPPFESVKEAVDRFGGSGPWFPHHLLRPPPPPLQDLIMKEQEAVNVLREVEAAKRYVEGLKVNLMEGEEEEESSSGGSIISSASYNSTQRMGVFPVESPGGGYAVMEELNRAKVDLNKMSGDLSAIRASVECLNKKVKSERRVLGKNFECEQLQRMAEASRYEVMKATLDIQRTKESMKMAEMRLIAAKKIEEAAKAVEAIALAERKSLLNGKSFSEVSSAKPNEEYYALAQKAQNVEDLWKTKLVDDSNADVITPRKEEENVKCSPSSKRTLKEPTHTKKHLEEALGHGDGSHQRRKDGVLAKFKDSNHSPRRENPRLLDDKEPGSAKHKPVPVFRSSISIGDVLSSRKAIPPQDNDSAERRQQQAVSFSQMLREQSGIVLSPAKSLGRDGGAQRKKFGFMLPKQNKKRAQTMN